MKKCPYCAEEIQDEAIVCKHCGRDLTSPVTPKITNQVNAPKRTLIFIAAVGLIVGAFLPWASLHSILGTLSVTGIEGDGQITAIVGLIIGLAALAYTSASKRGLGWLILLISIGSGLLALSKLFNISSMSLDSEVPTTIGIGLSITCISAFLGFLGALSALSKSKVSEKPVANPV